MGKRVGILTAGGDSPGLNAAIRGFGKAAIGHHGMELLGFRDGLRGLVEDRWQPLDGSALAGILTIGGTILGTSRFNPLKENGGITQIRKNLHRHRIDAIVNMSPVRQSKMTTDPDSSPSLREA